jgi:1-acyl-sn-glycerol-3-phosphate acyltransferase
MLYPHYPSINPTVLKCLLRRKRSLRADTARLCQQVDPPIQYAGLEYLALPQPFVVTVNHYARPGFSTAWIAVAISAVLPGETTWIMSNQWLFLGHPLGFVLRPLMRFILRSITLTYGFIPMPSMVAGYSTPQERTAGVRETIERVRDNPNCILGITPEGMDSPDGKLMLPPPGVGRFLLHLQQMRLPLLPAAVFEAEGVLHVHFGKPYQLTARTGLSSSELDLFLRKQIIERIAILISSNKIDR